MGICPTSHQQARAKARVALIALGRDRFARDQRVQAPVAVAMGERESVCVARMCELTAGEARRLRRSACTAHDCRVGVPRAEPHLGNPPDRSPSSGPGGTSGLCSESMRSSAL